MADLPYPVDEGSTHWAGCYRERRHHNCAVVEVDRLRAENERLREALEGLIDAGQHPATMDGLGHGYTLSRPFVTALTHAREALEATDE